MTPVRAPVDLRTLPIIRAEAERLARDVYEAQSKTLHANGMGPSLLWELLPERTRSAYVGGHLDLLCDLTRPASRDAVARLVAAGLGVEIEATAPHLWRDDSFHTDWGGAGWVLGYPGDRVACFTDECPEHFFTRNLWFDVPGISTITDPAEALRLIALHVLRSPDV